MRTVSASPTLPTVSRQDVLTFDVADAETDRFICSMSIPYNPLFRLRLTEILEHLYSKRPTLKYRKIIIELTV